jgi:hypothetical protein
LRHVKALAELKLIISPLHYFTPGSRLTFSDYFATLYDLPTELFFK